MSRYSELADRLSRVNLSYASYNPDFPAHRDEEDEFVLVRQSRMEEIITIRREAVAALRELEQALESLQRVVRQEYAKREALEAELDSANRKNLQLHAERDRLREALEQIVNCTPANQPDKWPHHHHYLFVARAALEDKT